MSFPDHAAAFRSFISRSSSTSKVAASIVMSAATIVAIGAAAPPREAFDPVDMKAIQQVSASHANGASSRLVFLETDPDWYSEPAAGQTSVYMPPPENPDIEASMVSGHVQAF